MTSLEKSILETLAFFDVFSYPLTVSEIWKWLYKPKGRVSFLEVKQALVDSQILKDEVSQIEAFYCLKGKEYTYFRRKQNNNLAEKKFSKAIRLIKLYRLIPFVRMVAICNSLAYSNANEDSDIDFFIITKKGTIWLARFFTVLFVRFLGQRPQQSDTKDAICLTFFVDETNLNLKNICLHSNDIYMPYWIGQLMPVYDPDKLYSKFLEANKWYQQYLPNNYINQFSKQVRETKLSKLAGKIFQFIVSPPIISRWLNTFYRRLQVSIIDYLLSMYEMDYVTAGNFIIKSGGKKFIIY